SPSRGAARRARVPRGRLSRRRPAAGDRPNAPAAPGRAGGPRRWLYRERSRSLALLSHYEWIFLSCFWSNVLTACGSGSNMIAGPYFCPFVIAHLTSFLMLAAFAECFCTSTYV